MHAHMHTTSRDVAQCVGRKEDDVSPAHLVRVVSSLHILKAESIKP